MLDLVKLIRRYKSTKEEQPENDQWNVHGKELKLDDWSHVRDGVERRNPLEEYFRGLNYGPGIWKWTHYFDAYHTHLARFRHQAASVLEIGVYSGGSLKMWQQYFNETARIYGVDIEPACKSYESGNISILIGDQEDRAFWQSTRTQIPSLDVVIDDGGHLVSQQRISFEELFPHLQPGGVYICEDIHGKENSFASYLYGVSSQLNEMYSFTDSVDDAENRLTVTSNQIQKYIRSIHFYPFLAVIERNDLPRAILKAAKHGTEWQPFLK